MVAERNTRNAAEATVCIIERVGLIVAVDGMNSLSNAFATFDGQELNPSIKDKISAITYSLVSNHGFVDGNKRVGVAVMLLLLQMNGIHVAFEQCKLVELGLGIASGGLKADHIKDWIDKHRV